MEIAAPSVPLRVAGSSVSSIRPLLPKDTDLTLARPGPALSLRSPHSGLKVHRLAVPATPANSEKEAGCVSVLLIPGHRESVLGNTVQSVVALLSNLVTCKDSNTKLLCEHGLVHHVCNLFTAAATLCLDVDDKPSTEVAATLLFSLLDILHGMLTYMSGVVRLALQAQKSSSGGDTQAAEDLLLLGKPLTALAGLLIRLLPGEDPEVFEVSSKCLSILVQLYGGAVPDSLCPENAESFARVLASRKDPKDQKLLLRTLRRMVTSSEQHRVRLEQADTLQWVLERLAQAEGSPDKGVVASLALDILRSLGSLQEGT
ncbi:Serine/threonine-protein kinase ULK4 [Fukomys damarensis]|uniref:Serine/threonine-protein kinase ULK4 n=1 Tax=Fukomys damarensis TaxID=885580 RepID=A0A091DQG1_FUKDA|nr:Serine/threonine-protein kinase ULK4 [Fukomys damarensis]